MKKLSKILLILMAMALILLLGFPLLTLYGTDVGKIKLDESISLPFKVDRNKSIILLYFGYVGCREVCPTSLNEIGYIYKKARNRQKIGVYFIDITQNQGAGEYAKFFNKNFKGIALPKYQTMKLMYDLHAYKSDALSQAGELYHTSYLYLIKRVQDGFVLKDMYDTYPYDANLVIDDIKKELR